MRGLGASRFASMFLASCCIGIAAAAESSRKVPQIQTLPGLQEQADIVNSWTEERKKLIPGLLRKYGVDAWLVGDPLVALTHTLSLSLSLFHWRIKRR